MKRLIILLVLLMPLIAYGEVLFTQTFDTDNFDETDWDPKYNFAGVKFGPSDDKIQNAYNDWFATGYPFGTGGSHQVPLFGISTCSEQINACGNFDIYLAPSWNINQSTLYVRFCLYLPARMIDGGDNWKLAYNYWEGDENLVFWFRGRAEGYTPELYITNGEFQKTEACAQYLVANYEDQWTCFEYYKSGQDLKLWITTPSALEDYNDTLYIDSTWGGEPAMGTTIGAIQIGAFWDGPEQDFGFLTAPANTTDTTITLSCPKGSTGQANYTPYSACDNALIDRYQPGDVVTIESEQMQVVSYTTNGSQLIVTRGYGGTSAASHADTTLAIITTWDTEIGGFLIDEIVVANTKIGPPSWATPSTYHTSSKGGSFKGGSLR